ncbi:hypothetical protein BOTBODRAFT_157895 [Botryobasidium botryosum FD-172 SS1]|uniref:Pyridoxamine 5'-phosphate oxidase Alr4036 family FMN-binding domain-containing protein n=1 Tax=Botryobasidium botryosum (strain FD-172 SS1) TaxID=930990 RepID=A0A067MJ75_BOTB1|nr:hypothetical protein BOTBODRAFT_157895 [Botryobasidium botryosum FD-172 SS1]
MNPAQSQAPRWYTQLTATLEKHKRSTTYSLSTVEPGTHIPRGRHVAHRQFISPGSPSVPLLITTTDVRSPKVSQVTPLSGGGPENLTPNAEVAWWIADASEQYRISAQVHILPHPSHELHKSFPSDRPSMGGGRFGWEAYRRQMFNETMSPFMRATFCRRQPGAPMESYSEGDQWITRLASEEEVADGEEKKNIDEAMLNFALVVVEPMSVDLLELGVQPNQRTIWARQNGGEVWEERVVIP